MSELIPSSEELRSEVEEYYSDTNLGFKLKDFHELYEEANENTLIQVASHYDLSLKGLTFEEAEKTLLDVLLEKENMKKALLRCNKGVLDALQDINQNDEAELNCAQVYALSSLSKDGYGRFDYFEEYCIDAATLEGLCALIDDQEFRKVWEKASYTYALVHYALSLYGVLDEDVLHVMYEEKWHGSTIEEMNKMWKLVEDNDIVHNEEEHKYYLASILWMPNYDEVQELQKKYERDLLTVEDVEDYLNYGFPYSKVSYQDLLGYLAHYFVDEMPSRNYERVVDLFHLARSGGDLDGYVEAYMTKISDFVGGAPLSPITRSEVTTYIYNCAGETRMGILNGHYLDDTIDQNSTLEGLVNLIRNHPEDLMKHMPENLPAELEEAFEQLMESLGEEEFDDSDDSDDDLVN